MGNSIVSSLVYNIEMYCAVSNLLPSLQHFKFKNIANNLPLKQQKIDTGFLGRILSHENINAD
jgi:hypothetical protein